MGDFFDGLGSAALNFLGTQLTNQATADRADSSNEWSAAQYASRYQTMTKDLQAAGLNPMLAYSQSPGASPSAQQVQFQNPMASATEAYHKSAERDLMSAQISNINADSQLKANQAKLALVSAEKEAALERQATTNANESTYRLWSQQNVQNPTQKALAASYWSQIDVNKATLPKIAQEIKTGGAYAAQAFAAAEKAHSERKLNDEEWFVVKNAADYAKKTGLLDNSLRSISTATGAIRDLRPGGIYINNQPQVPLGSGKVSSRIPRR